MYVCNIRVEFQMEIEQRYVVSYFHRKEMKLPAIVAELAAVFHEDAFDENRVKYWLHEIQSHRSDLSDRPSSGRPPLGDIIEEQNDWRVLDSFSTSCKHKRDAVFEIELQEMRHRSILT
jgi:hypothetical protein